MRAQKIDFDIPVMSGSILKLPLQHRFVLGMVYACTQKYGECRLSDATFAQAMSCSRATANRVIRRLCTDGWLIKKVDHKDDSGFPRRLSVVDPGLFHMG